MVPNELRESGLALGLSRWRVILFVVFPAASQGILTGVLLAVARVAGETAPLLFTAFGNPHWSLDMERPIATLPHTLFTYAIAPYADWQTKAWGAALVLSAIILITNLSVRAINRRGFGLVSK